MVAVHTAIFSLHVVLRSSPQFILVQQYTDSFLKFNQPVLPRHLQMLDETGTLMEEAFTTTIK